MIDQKALNVVVLYHPLLPGFRITVTNMPTAQLRCRLRAMGMASPSVALAL
jgi:hypothetical protein